MNLTQKVIPILCCFILYGLTGCSSPDSGKSPDTYSSNVSSNEKTTVSINNYISVNTKESPDDEIKQVQPANNNAKHSQPSKEVQAAGNSGVKEAPIETPHESEWVQTDQGHKFCIPDGFSPVGMCGPETGKSYCYSNPDLQMTIEVWEDTADHLAYESGWEWISEEYRAYERDLYDTTQQKADNYFMIQGLTQEANAFCIRDQFISPWTVKYMLSMDYPSNDSYRTGEFQRICREFSSNFQYAASSAPTEAPNEFKKEEIEDAEEIVAQIRSWYYEFQEEKGKCTTKTINNATAYYLNGEIQSIELLNNEGGTREFYYYAPGSQRLYFVYLEGISDNTNQKRVYIWEGQLVQWIDPSGTVRHDDPEKLLAGCSQVSVYQFGLFAN